MQSNLSSFHLNPIQLFSGFFRVAAVTFAVVPPSCVGYNGNSGTTGELTSKCGQCVESPYKRTPHSDSSVSILQLFGATGCPPTLHSTRTQRVSAWMPLSHGLGATS